MSSQNGRLLWSQPVDSVTGPVSDGHNVYVVTAQGDIQAFDYETGKPAWTNKDLKWRTPSAPVPMNKVILVGDYDGVIHALDQATGEIVGRTTVSGAVNVAPLALGEGRVLVQPADGEIAALTLSE